MKVLLDTHCWLWMLEDSEKLSAGARALVRDPEHELFFSAASAWEIAIKYAQGKLRLPQPPSTFVPHFMTAGGVGALPILHSHTLHAGNLPPHHRDPFDRMLIAQAQVEELTVLTADAVFGKYDVAIHWM